MEDRRLDESNVSNVTQPVRLPPRHPWLNGKRRAMEKARKTYVELSTPERTPVPTTEPRIIVKQKRRPVFD